MSPAAIRTAAHCRIPATGWYATGLREVELHATSAVAQVKRGRALWEVRVEEKWALDSAAQKA
jgi:hypothetical protein